MSFIEKVGAAVGLGAAKVSVSVEREEYHWNDTLDGTTTIQGGTLDQSGSELKVSVLEHWVTRDAYDRKTEHHEYYNEKTIAREVAIAAHSIQHWRFSVVVPAGQTIDHNWLAAARLCIP